MRNMRRGSCQDDEQEKLAVLERESREERKCHQVWRGGGGRGRQEESRKEQLLFLLPFLPSSSLIMAQSESQLRCNDSTAGWPNVI